MANEIEQKSTKNEIAEVEDSNELLPQQGLKDQVQEILSDLDIVKKEALDGFYLFKDLLANEGEGSAATKEQMSSMLNLYLSTIDTRLKAVSTLVKAQKESKPQGTAQASTNINIMGGLNRRDMIKEIEKIMEADNVTDLADSNVEIIEDAKE